LGTVLKNLIYGKIIIQENSSGTVPEVCNMGIIFYLFVFIFGLIVGSFLNCLIYRLALPSSTQNIECSVGGLKNRSYCPFCKHILGWQDLIPVFSFLFLKGKCRYCKKPISFQYPLVELATGLLFLLIINYQLFPKIEILSNLTIVELLDVCFLFFVSCFLIIIFVYDLKHFIIPNQVIYPAITIAFIYNVYQLAINNQQLAINNFLSAFGAAAFFLIIVLISKGKWMGVGDIKLAFFMGLLLSFPNILVALFLSFLIGAIIGIGLILTE